MPNSRVQISHQKGEVFPNVWDDFAWVHDHRKELLEAHGECVILVYKHEVVGKGSTIEEAQEDAERRLPPDITHITPVIEFLSHRNPFQRVRPTIRN